MINCRVWTDRTGTSYYLESWDRQEGYRLLPGELGQAGRLKIVTWRAGTGRKVTDCYLES